MEAEAEFDGDALAVLLVRADGQRLADAMAGCLLYRDDPDAAERVVVCDAGRVRATVRRADGRTREVAVRGAFLIDTSGRLGAAVEGATTPGDRTLAADLARVATFGLTGRIEAGDAALLAAVIRAIERDHLDDASERRRAVALAVKYGDARTVLRFTDQWLRLAGGTMLADVLIAHVKALRDLGEVGQALAATEAVTRADHGLTRAAEAVLLTQRAALWLDLAERRDEAALLERARAAAARAWGLGRSEELSAVYRRLDRIAEEAGDTTQAAAARTADNRLRSARSAWEPIRPGNRPGR